VPDDIDSQLRDVIRRRSYRRGKFRLASGAESEFYFNLKPTMMSPEGAYLSARALLARIRAEQVDYVGGLEMGAVPVIACIAALSQQDGAPVKTFFVRKKPKDHGTQDLLEGLAHGESLTGMRVMIVDDVATSGGSIVKAADVARAAGATVETALVIIDREEGATAALQKVGIRLFSVLRTSDFL
jgi:orotate phosphoribosyltransferase